MAPEQSTYRPANDAYTGMLAISLIALITGSALLFLDYQQYPEASPKPPDKMAQKLAEPKAPEKPPEVKEEPKMEEKKDDKGEEKKDEMKKDDMK